VRGRERVLLLPPLPVQLHAHAERARRWERERKEERKANPGLTQRVTFTLIPCDSLKYFKGIY
jgi:hypothetical protein